MQTINVQSKQSWQDLAVQGYGNVDAVVELLSNSVKDETETDLADACALATVQVDEASDLMNKTALRALAGAVIATL